MSNLSSKQEKMAAQATTNNTTARRGINRRNFLKVSAVGAGALAAMPTFGTTERVSAAPITPERGNGEYRLQEKNDANSLVELSNAAETWAEPWTWRPGDWPGQPLPLHVVENAAPMAITGANFNNAKPLLFSYNGTTPGPTIRMKGDETLFIHLRNLLGPDLGKTPVGVYGDPNEGFPAPEGALFQEKILSSDPFGPDFGQMPAVLREDWCLGEHTNGVHSNHVTNLHTHGLHVRPATNPDGTHSDNVILRVMPQADWQRREADIDASCRLIRENEVIGQAPYEFRLGNVQDNPDQPHPAGTFWYHPHAHGATHNQVAAGMAGFLIVEGDIEQALYDQLVKSDIADNELKNPVNELPYDPSRRTGPFDYRERLMFIQRVTFPASDTDAPPDQSGGGKRVIFDTTNGGFEPRVITMRPGAIERWRILNGSVDGKSYMRFMVLKGRYEFSNDLVRIEKGSPSAAIPLMADLQKFKQRLWLLAWDGITLVQKADNEQGAKYYIQDLNFDVDLSPEETDKQASGDNWYKDAASIKAAYVRPNELDMSAANRADVLFQAPMLDDGTDAQIYTIVARGTPLHADGAPRPDTIVAYLIVRGDKVEGMRSKDAGTFKRLDKELNLPPVADYLKPITNNELKVLRPSEVSRQLPPQQRHVLQNEIKQYNQTVGQKTKTVVNETTSKKTTFTTVQKPKKVKAGDFRTRKITYSGWGANDFPVVTVPDKYVKDYPKQQKLRYYKAPKSITIPEVDLPKGITLPGGSNKIDKLTITNLTQPNGSPLPTLLLPPGTRTMAIDGRKFNPTDPVHPQMLWWTAEEWMLTNNSTTLWHQKDEKPILFTADNVPADSRIKEIVNTLTTAIKQAPARQDLNDVKALYNSLLPEKDKKTDKYKYDHPTYWGGRHHKAYPMTRSEARKKGYQLAVKAADHPFHIHQNPFWVMRIDVPDEKGNLVNILDQPRWQDTIWIPRNGGRVIFRSRFPDYLGTYVNHCHLLLHEDNGMMQAVETVPTANSANYRPASAVLDPNNIDKNVDTLYPTDSKNLGQAWLDSMQFIDPDPKTGQVYPGFKLEVPSPNS